MTAETLGWIDMATTGVDADKDLILGLSCAVTSLEFDLVDHQYFPIAIDELPDTVPSKVLEMHLSSGVLGATQDKIARSLTDTIGTVQAFFREGGTVVRDVNWYSPLCGFGVRLDRNFLEKQMRPLHSLFMLADFDAKAVFAMSSIDTSAIRALVHPSDVLAMTIKLCKEHLA